MFLGHFAVALAGKRVAPRASLGGLVFAAQFADLLWPTLLLAGIERAHVVPGATVVTPLRFDHYPWSHSLATLCLAGAAIGLGWFLVRRRGREALVLALLVPSHWLLDWFVHVPDLPLAPGAAARHGLGLWNSLPGTLLVELSLFAAGSWLYLRTTRPRDRIGRVATGGLLGVLALVFAANLAGPPPPGIAAVAWVGQAQWLLVAWAWWADRHRGLEGARA